ncbi:AAA family ATPase [Eubacterium callanderi]|uniref:ATP-binding protein n=1 Tax=Eubacterium callanderi TaxID=53442 RepID=UPI001C2DEB03|nr:AAA family ATPase [Eubacterium callanderi]MBV1684075.1 AAA family ATPase [Eubacterium callanderi]
MSKTKIIAFAGKGGVGKTSLAALTVRLLVERNPGARVLAIDADPAVGLSTALGVEVSHTVDDVRKKFIETVEKGKKKEAIEVLNEAHYEITDSVVETERFAFLAIGRPENAGCYCSVNSFLKETISVLAEQFDYVVIDGEAGIEQVNRRVMEKVTHLILVSDASKKGIGVIHTIRDVARELGMYNEVGAIINRIKNDTVKEMVDTGDIEVLNFISEDEALGLMDIEGRSLLELKENALSLKGVREALIQINVI